MRDRTKEIVEAAERLADTVAELARISTGDVHAKYHALVRALALPSPQWTRTPPSEPGFYWWRQVTHRGPDPRAMIRWLSASDAKAGVVIMYSPTDNPTPFELGGEWWPVPIEEPPA